MIRIHEKRKSLPLPLCFNVAFISNETLRDTLKKFIEQVKIFGSKIDTNKFTLTRQQANELLAVRIKLVSDSPHSREEFSAWLRCSTLLSQENRYLKL